MHELAKTNQSVPRARNVVQARHVIDAEIDVLELPGQGARRPFEDALREAIVIKVGVFHLDQP